MSRPKDAHGNRPEVDLFPEVDEIYSKVLGCFDVAIEALSPPKAPIRIQPDRRVKRQHDGGPTGHPLPKAKEARVDQQRRPPPNSV